MEEGKDILLVDDHSLILQGIASILNQIPEISRVYTANSVAAAAGLITSRYFDIYMLDIEFPDGSGFDLIKQIRDKYPDACIVINTMHERTWVINKLIKCEVNSIILKSSDAKVVKQAISSVLDNRSYCCPRFEHLSRKLRNGRKNDHPDNIPTKRELEVLKAMAKGNNTQAIGRSLGISENTVETYRKQLFLKFDAKNGIDLVLKAMLKGWVEIES